MLNFMSRIFLRTHYGVTVAKSHNNAPGPGGDARSAKAANGEESLETGPSSK